MSNPEDEFPRLKHPISRILAGLMFLILGIISLLSAFAAATTADLSAKVWAQFVLAAVGGWLGASCLLFSYRLLLNRPRHDGGLLSPMSLRIGAAFFVGLPLASLATGAWKNNFTFPWVLLPMIGYIVCGVSMWTLARIRSRQLQDRSESSRGAVPRR